MFFKMCYHDQFWLRVKETQNSNGLSKDDISFSHMNVYSQTVKSSLKDLFYSFPRELISFSLVLHIQDFQFTLWPQVLGPLPNVHYSPSSKNQGRKNKEVGHRALQSPLKEAYTRCFSFSLLGKTLVQWLSNIDLHCGLWVTVHLSKHQRIYYYGREQLLQHNASTTALFATMSNKERRKKQNKSLINSMED